MWIIFAQSYDKEYDLCRVMIYIKQNIWECFTGEGYLVIVLLVIYVILIQGVLLWENYC